MRDGHHVQVKNSKLLNKEKKSLFVCGNCNHNYSRNIKRTKRWSQLTYGNWSRGFREIKTKSLTSLLLCFTMKKESLRFSVGEKRGETLDQKKKGEIDSGECRNWKRWEAFYFYLCKWVGAAFLSLFIYFILLFSKIIRAWTSINPI